MSEVAVWNADETFLHNVPLKHAISMLHRRVAEIHEAVDGERFGPYARPKVLRLIRYVVRRWEYGKTKATYSREGVLARDRERCAYCGLPGADTMDHVLPRSRGGATSWVNAVAAHRHCNQAKGNRMPEEAGMPLLWEPYIPTRGQLHRAKTGA